MKNLYEQYLKEMDIIKEDQERRLEIIDKLPSILKQEWEFLKNLGIIVPEHEILKDYKLIPWWKRLFMTSNQKKLEKAKIALKKITEWKAKNEYKSNNESKIT